MITAFLCWVALPLSGARMDFLTLYVLSSLALTELIAEVVVCSILFGV